MFLAVWMRYPSWAFAPPTVAPSNPGLLILTVYALHTKSIVIYSIKYI
jgi:hypothetical protein